MSFPADKLFFVKSEHDFEEAALAVFSYQAQHCRVYRDYLNLVGISPFSVKNIYKIPFLPVEFFKTHKIITDEKQEELIFQSSGTTASGVSKHFVADAGTYTKSFEKSFALFYGSPEEYCILALLPSYLSQKNSSLAYMVSRLIEKSHYPESSFYLSDYEKLFFTLQKLAAEKIKTILLGVSYALLDFVQNYPLPLNHVIVMETGGMKGRRQEITRNELHQLLCTAFRVEKIHSEYGMTELLSQAYSRGSGIFQPPPWMNILFRNPGDPFSVSKKNKDGVVNIIDFANVYSCSFIATQDLGNSAGANQFEIIGRTDNSDLRGCNLMISDI
jgi:hypothetical protein